MGRQDRRVGGAPHGALALGISVSPDGRLAASGGPDGAGLGLATGRLVATLEGHSDEVWSAEFSPDSRWLVTASFDRTADLGRRGRADRVRLRGHTHSVSSACFSPDGGWVLTGSLDGTARVREVDTGRTVQQAAGPHPRGRLRLLQPGRDAGRDRQRDATARYWDAHAGQSRELEQLAGP